MKQKLVLALLAFATAAAISLLQARSRHIQTIPVPRPSSAVIRCSPDWNLLSAWLEETDIPPFPGAGNWKMNITTGSDSARYYFNQGMNMYYSFHIIESMASFNKAAKFDPQSALIQWARALAFGPNINDFGYAASPEALEAVHRADLLSRNGTDLEKRLIYAMSVRYTADSADKNRAQLNQAYADAMKSIYQQYNSDGNVAALYADALMLQHPWDLWKNDGTPQPWEPDIQQVLEKTLKEHPDNPGANHYYIHVMEASPFAYKALPCANRLGKLTPGLSHTVHMPSHIYLRTGNYKSGVAVNETAVKQYEDAIPRYSPVQQADFLYIIHNLHMQTTNAMLDGRSSYSASSAAATVKSIPTEYYGLPGGLGNTIQYISMTPLFVDIRFGNWNNLLQTRQPDASRIYSNLLWHFGRGMAFAHTGENEKAKTELAALELLMKDSSLLAGIPPFSPPAEGAKVAYGILAGSIAATDKNWSEAVAAFQTASVTEDNMVYDEPRDWLLSARHYLADALIRSGQFSKVEAALKNDLARNAGNGWALFGLWQSLEAQHKTAAAQAILKRFQIAFQRADVKLYGPVF